MSLKKPLDTGLDTGLDTAMVARFEQSRDSASPVSIESCLPGESTAEYSATLVELVLIDLEFGWKAQLENSGGLVRGSAVSLQGYVDRFAALQDREVFSDLVVRTLCLRQQMGDHPDVRACLQAYPGLFESERELLSRLAATGYSLRSPTVSLAVTRDAQAIMSTFLGGDTDPAAVETIPQSGSSEAMTVLPVEDATLAPVRASGGVDQALRQSFEQAWVNQQPRGIASCLPPEESESFLPTLVELVGIDLEFQWKQRLQTAEQETVRDELSNPPLVEDYLNEFSDLNTPEIMLSLLQQEFWARARFSEEPEIEEYHERFPDFEINGASLTATDLALTVGSREEIERARSDDKRDGTEAMTVPPSAGAGQSEFDDIPDTVGNYRLDRELGAGGMGRVYRATDLNSGQEVALKLVLPQLVTSEESMDRFRQEGRLAGGITHPRCVFVLAADQDGRFPYIAMEFVPGTNLHDYVVSEGPLEQEDAIRKIIDVIDGLSAAHELGVIHRDIKPANCFVDDEGRVKVGDFGLSRTLTADIQLTQPGAFLGTPQYCAPEQIRNDPLDDRCDVYSVVATLYFTLTGQAPFHGSDALATMARVVSDPAPPIRKLRPDLPRGLEKVIAKGLERDPKRRWQSMQELKNALLEFSSEGALSARVIPRLGSFLIDLLFCFFGTMVTYVLSLQVNQVGLSERDETSLTTDVYLGAIFLSICVCYFTLCEGCWGRTIGKWLLKIRVRCYKRPEIGLRHAIVRSTSLALICYVLPIAVFTASSELIFNPGVMIPVMWILVISTMRKRNGRRGLHELISGTCVIQEPKRSTSAESASRALDELSCEAESVTMSDGDWPSSIGPYQVSHAVRWDDGERVLAARDGQLNRNVWILLRDSGCAPVSATRAQLDRSSRLRWVSSGTCGENQFDAFLAPSGRSLDEVVRESGTLTWPDTRRLLQTVATELEQAIEDGTLPDQLSTYQVWLKPDGKALLVDCVVLIDAQQVAAGLVSPTDRGFALLGATAVRALEGGPTGDVTKRQSIKHVVCAVIPVFARDTLRRLFPGKHHYDDISEFQESLDSGLQRPVQEVTRPRRAQLSIAQIIFCFLVLGVGINTAVAVERHWPGSLSPVLEAQSTIEGVIGGFAYVLLIPPLYFSIWSMCFPSGWVWRLAFVQIVGPSGAPASRLRVAWRTYITWFPCAALLLLQRVIANDGQLGSLHIDGTWRWVPWVTLAVIYLLISLIWPRRGPQDVLAGTYLVPR